MKNATFHVEVLKAQGVTPLLASHIVDMVDEIERENARLRAVAERMYRMLNTAVQAPVETWPSDAEICKVLHEFESLRPNTMMSHGEDGSRPKL